MTVMKQLLFVYYCLIILYFDYFILLGESSLQWATSIIFFMLINVHFHKLVLID